MAARVHYKDIAKQMKKDVDTFMGNYDKNKDGKVTRDEIITGLKEMNTKYPDFVADYLFEDDNDGNGELSLEEVKERILKIEDERIDAILEWDVKQFLKLNDKNGDKEVTKDELLESFSATKAANPKAVVDCIFKQMDINSDCKITPNEIREYNRKKKFTL